MNFTKFFFLIAVFLCILINVTLSAPNADPEAKKLRKVLKKVANVAKVVKVVKAVKAGGLAKGAILAIGK
jgi:hypothetical protein